MDIYPRFTRPRKVGNGRIVEKQPFSQQMFEPISGTLLRDSSDVEADMSPEAIQIRLKTLGQLSRLVSYLAQGKVIGQVADRVSPTQSTEEP